jgi:DNA-binding CsgD family transcriptional regulator
MVRFFDDVRGYHLAEVLTEGSAGQTRWGLAGGYQLRSDYSESYSEEIDPGSRRCLLGISRDEALASGEGSAMSMVFNYTPPRFAFSRPQRRLLAHALQHKTDAEIAEDVGVSLSAVKKTWAAIFEKVSSHFPEASWAEVAPASEGGRPTRGAQKRHTLLTYLQTHPEELRP